MFVARPLSTEMRVIAGRTHLFEPGVKMDSMTAYLGQYLRFHSKLWFVRIQRLESERALVEFERIKDGRERLSAGCFKDLTSEGSFLGPRLSDAGGKQLIAWPTSPIMATAQYLQILLHPMQCIQRQRPLRNGCLRAGHGLADHWATCLTNFVGMLSPSLRLWSRHREIKFKSE